MSFSSPATFFTEKKVAFLHPTFGRRVSLKEVTPITLLSKAIHVISNGKMPMEQLSEILADIHPYADAIHLREKQMKAKELYEAVNLLSRVGVPLSKIIINDRVDVAVITGVEGVQLAYHSLNASMIKANFPQLTVGCSIHSVEEGKKVQRLGADYVIYGHIFSTQSKPGLEPRGLEELKKLTGSLDIPVIAIGGIAPENTKQVINSGADGIAVMSGVLNADDPLSAIKSYQKEVKMEMC
ncbi:thiazole tautomerase TenI [Lysinibacillus sp. NPDC095746]|uniref:thiazole tautomerase TenI n=1 Tax=Lysinibacillus sp. NPDC095746 TaxID=3364134 RepID=UPI00382538D0